MTSHGIRRVDVELLRRGERDNQLLSTYTDYLAVCGPEPSGVVHVPMPHGEMLRMLDELRYEVDRHEPGGLQSIRSKVGSDLARMLGAIPGLAGRLAPPDHESLTHLRVTVSAAELALLPFEMAKVPVDRDQTGDGWLLLQPNAPVSLTRHVRGVAPEAHDWSMQPRILFIAGRNVPFEEHLDAFSSVLEPWHGLGLEPARNSPSASDAPYIETPWLTVLRDANIEAIKQTVASHYFTHVHLLAHGAPIQGRHELERFGVQLGNDIVTGRDLALALSTRVGRPARLPAVVTLASCDSAGQGSVVTGGGSVAFELHAAGVPIVVASQFPISKAASLPFVRQIYAGQLRGEHPLRSVSDLRQDLKTRFPDEHAWASVVVYESFPTDYESRLVEIAYWQRRRARDRAIADLEAAVASSLGDAQYEELVDRVLACADDLPVSGVFESECWGLRAAAYKVLAAVAFSDALRSVANTGRAAARDREQLERLDQAAQAYRAALVPLVQSGHDSVQRKAKIHWLAGQILALDVVLGRGLDPNALGMARYSALADLDSLRPIVRSWANVSMLELNLLALANTDGGTVEDPTVEQQNLMSAIDDHAQQILALDAVDPEPARQTALQLRRYVDWWTSKSFHTGVLERGGSRKAALAPGGIVAAAADAIAAILHPHPTPSPAVAIAPHFAQGHASPPVAADAAATKKVGVFRIELVQAGNGDCLWISYGEHGHHHHIMIDCGATSAAERARDRIISVDHVELFVMTHIDADHISGAIPLFADEDVVARLGDVWFNGPDQLPGLLSVTQGEEFAELLDRDDRTFLWNGSAPPETPRPIFTDGNHPEVTLPGGMQLTILSPTPAALSRLAKHWKSRSRRPEREMLGGRVKPTPVVDPASFDVLACALDGATSDTSIPNLSSIAFLAEFGGRAVLFTGDAHADVLAASIAKLQAHRGRPTERLRLDALKLSHHGSATATTQELLQSVDCAHYLVPTNGATFYHPDRQAIARVLEHGGAAPTLHFNHRTEFNELWDHPDLKKSHGHNAIYPADGADCLSVNL